MLDEQIATPYAVRAVRDIHISRALQQDSGAFKKPARSLEYSWVSELSSKDMHIVHKSKILTAAIYHYIET